MPTPLVTTTPVSEPASKTEPASKKRKAQAAEPEGVPITSVVECMLRGRYEGLDADAPKILSVLQATDAPLIWHKHSAFIDHLREVWAMLVNWGQPQAFCRLGLVHSAYSNSFVSMNCFNPKTERPKLAELIGEEAENLVYKFCSIDRQALEDMVLEERTIRAEGYVMKHIHTSDPVQVSGKEAAAFIIETLADEVDQRFGWQSDLEVGATMACWPGPMLPTLRLSRTSRLAHAIRTSSLIDEAALPPIFDKCSVVLSLEDETAARDAYWEAVSFGGVVPDGSTERTEKQLKALATAAARNPYLAEPHVISAQCYLQLGRWEEAEASARRGVELLCVWGTQWDKRMPYNAWLNWARCMALQAQWNEWPTTHGGMESLGATMPRMRFRGLNAARSMEKEP